MVDAAKQRMEMAKLKVSTALAGLEHLFVPGMKLALTLIARLPGHDDADFVMTSDDMVEVRKAVERHGGLGVERG